MTSAGPVAGDTGGLEKFLARAMFGVGPVTCAVSGGADSMALLVLAHAAGLEVTAIHVDHGLRDGSEGEGDRVEEVAGRLGVGFERRTVALRPGPNLEARARAARYGCLPVDVLTGHTADDQAETVLLAMLRGSAWHGLGGIAPGPNRPLLGLRRTDTEAVCETAGIVAVHDPSNDDPTHRRNRVRHELLPLLESIADRDLVPVLTRQAELLRDGGSVIAELAAELDPADARALAGAPLALAREAVRMWLRAGCGREHPPDLATVDRVLAVARLEARATDVGGGWRVARSRLRLQLERDPRMG